jgi:hypothetical protein
MVAVINRYRLGTQADPYETTNQAIVIECFIFLVIPRSDWRSAGPMRLKINIMSICSLSRIVGKAEQENLKHQCRSVCLGKS